ncbi:MAG: LytTR family DNA-binding domain-containing protein [Hungatella sp.]
MRKYTIWICDDEISVRQQLKKYILNYAFSYDIEIELRELDSPKILLEFEPIYDILLLDIRFKDKNIGIDVGEALRARGNTAIIVLITHFASMAIDGYRAEPFRFLKKPFTEEQMTTVLKDCLQKLNRTVSYLTITSDSLSETFRTDKIIYIYSKLRKRYVVCSDKNIITTWQSLNDMKKCLPDDSFVYTHKSFIVNLNMVESVEGDVIRLVNDKSVPLSLHYKELFMKALQINVYH